MSSMHQSEKEKAITASTNRILNNNLLESLTMDKMDSRVEFSAELIPQQSSNNHPEKRIR
jgi:hypothetical protein